MSLWIPIITAFLGAAITGLISWLQTTRDQVLGAAVARKYLIENLEVAETRLLAALDASTNWWWPPVAAPPTGAWHEYHAVLREDLGEPYAREVAETFRKLDDLNAWAVTQWEQEHRRLALVSDARLKLTPEEVAASQAVLDKLGPKYDLGSQEHGAIEEALHSVRRTLEHLRTTSNSRGHDGVASTAPAPKRVALRRRRSLAFFSVPIALAVVLTVVLAITTQPTFTADKLDQAISEDFPRAAVSCDQLNEPQAEWDCLVAYSPTGTAAVTSRVLQAARHANGLGLVQTHGSSSSLSRILEYLIREEGKTNKFFGYLVGEEPPITKGAPLRPDGLPSVPDGPTASNTITGRVS